MSDARAFNPDKYLTKVGSSDYLEVKWRILGFRVEHPEGYISTELVEHVRGEYALFKAEAGYTLADGSHASGVDYGSETSGDFRDYLEKASTKAIGRALALLGYGTQFAREFEDGPGERLADSPIDISRTKMARDAIERNPAPATPKQVKFLYSLARQGGITDETLNAQAQELYGAPVDILPRRDVSAFIERLQLKQSEQIANHGASPAKPEQAVETPAEPEPVNHDRLPDRYVKRLTQLIDQFLQAGGDASLVDALVAARAGGSTELDDLDADGATAVGLDLKRATEELVRAELDAVELPS